MNGHKTWALWLAGTLGTFALWERKAFKARSTGKPSATLTATMRCWLGLKPRHPRRFVLAPMFAAFVIYLWGHFLHGKWNA